MTCQYLIVGFIVLTAVAVTLFRLIKFLLNPLRKCDGCSSNCRGCKLEELKKAIETRV